MGRCRVSFDARAVRHAYEAIADEHTERFAYELEVNAFDRAIVAAATARIPPHGLVLDIGCGPGQVSRHAASCATMDGFLGA